MKLTIKKIKKDFHDERKEHLLDLSRIESELDDHAITTEQIQRYLKEEQKLLKAYTELMSDNSKYSVARVKSILNEVIVPTMNISRLCMDGTSHPEE